MKFCRSRSWARPAQPSLLACVALLACADPLAEVARQLDRFAPSTPDLDDALDLELTSRWHHTPDLSPLAHARLFRWEEHNLALARWIDKVGGVAAVLELADALPGRLAARTLWRGVAEVCVLLRYRDAPQSDCGDVNALLDEHIGHVSRRIKELRSLERQLKALREQCQAPRTADHCGILQGLSAAAQEAAPAGAKATGHLRSVHGR